jgi:hypothetical protein
MEIHRSAGVSTLVALMAAHRATTGRGDPRIPPEVDPDLIDVDLARLTPALRISTSQPHGPSRGVSLRQSSRASAAFDVAGRYRATGVRLHVLPQP